MVGRRARALSQREKLIASRRGSVAGLSRCASCLESRDRARNRDRRLASISISPSASPARAATPAKAALSWRQVLEGLGRSARSARSCSQKRERYTRYSNTARPLANAVTQQNQFALRLLTIRLTQLAESTERSASRASAAVILKQRLASQTS